jgi:hypothetical protein
MNRTPPVYGLCCIGCGSSLELPADLTTIHINCPSCGVDNVLTKELIQARQRQYDQWLLSVERASQGEQQQLLQQRVLAARRAASRRSAMTLLVVLGALLLLPALVIGSLFALGLVFGKKAFHSLQEVQDSKKNGMPAVLSVIRTKQAEGCQRVIVDPSSRFGGAGDLHLQLRDDGFCVHLLGATSVASANLTLEQVSQHPLSVALPKPAPTFDYRLCANGTLGFDFSVHSNVDAPFTIAAIACPRTVAEGLVRSVAGDPLTTSVAATRDWVDDLRTRGSCQVIAEPAAFQGPQIVDVDSTKGGPCFNLLVASHFGDALLTVQLTSPAGKPMATPAPATRVRLEYCPSETGRHQVEIRPSTRDHYAMASMDCPRGAHLSLSRPAPLRAR